MGVFREYKHPDQAMLFPPSPRDWLSEDHLAWFIADTVDQLDLEAFVARYRFCGKGKQAYPPQMMLKVLLYAYCTGLFSSRKIAAALETDVALRVLGGELFPDFRTLCRFRNRHRSDFAGIFLQVVQIAQASGLVKLGTLAIDGSKVKANASKHQAMSYERMQQEEKRLREEIRKIVAAARKRDQLEDEQFGPDFRGDELPAELARRETRLKTIQEAKKRLEERKAQEDREWDERRARKAAAEGRDPPKARPSCRKYPKGKPKPKDQENFTDPDSRIMVMGPGHFEQCYNTQVAVDEQELIIVGNWVSQSAADKHHLLPTIAEVETNTGSKPKCVLADSGYRTEDSLRELRNQGVKGYIAIGREGKEHNLSARLPETRRMQRRIKSKRGRTAYKKRKHIVEPVFGWIKSILGFRQFSLRGLAKVRAEWDLVCSAMNLRRMGSQLAWR